jgi:predicted NAD/FAD-binding protein
LLDVDVQLFGRPQWLTVKGRSETYVAKVRRRGF